MQHDFSMPHGWKYNARNSKQINLKWKKEKRMVIGMIKSMIYSCIDEFVLCCFLITIDFFAQRFEHVLLTVFLYVWNMQSKSLGL